MVNANIHINDVTTAKYALPVWIIFSKFPFLNVGTIPVNINPEHAKNAVNWKLFPSDNSNHAGSNKLAMPIIIDGNKNFKAIAIVGKNISDTSFVKTLPCGYCRQFISEYADASFMIYTYDEENKKINSYSIKDLLPESFTL